MSVQTFSLPPGKYYIGDPCYVFSSKSWAELIRTDGFDDGPVVFRGRPLWAGHTLHGDGEYLDQFQNSFPVDSGLLGAVPVELIEQPPAEFETDLILDCPGGLIIGYDKTAGTFFFAHHVIYTDFVDYDEEYDEEYDQRDDDIFI